MSIRYRVALILVIVVGIYAILEFFIQHLVILPSFQKLEHEEAMEDLARAVGVLQAELENLDLLLFDWSAWDDTYEFAANPNAEYEKANLVDLTFTQNKLDLIYYVDVTGKVVWGQARDLQKEERIDMDEFPGRQWALTHPLLQHRTPESRLTGVFLTKHGPMLLSSRPIITSENKGPIRGTMLMGRFLDDSLVRRLCERAQVAMRVFPLNDENPPSEARKALAEITGDSPVAFREVGDHVIQLAKLLPGIDGKPALLLRVNVARDIMLQGRAVSRLMWTTTLSMVIAGVIIVSMLFQAAIVNPITKLTSHVTHVAATDGLTQLPPPSSKDEIGALTREFNQMVRRIQSDKAERVRAEDALRESEARIRAIIDTAPDGIITIDDKGLIETFNPAAERLFGYSVKEVAGKSMHELIPGLQVHAHAEEVHASGTATGPGIEGIAQRKDGSTFPVHWTVSEARLGGRSLFTAIVRDVTELKQMHESVLRAEHLATIGEMGASLAHEVRNPLAGISGAIQVLRDGFPLSDDRRKIVGEALEEVTRVDAIVRRLLMFAKMWLPARETVDLRRLAAKVTGEAQAREPWKDIDFAFSGEAVLEAPVDPSLVEQVLWNLLENAADAILRRKTERDEKGVIEWIFQRAPRSARVTLRDNGCGMTPEARQKLFRPFFTTKMYGTGLGLVICRRIMEAHGGSIEVASRDDKGAEVVLDFPLEVRS